MSEKSNQLWQDKILPFAIILLSVLVLVFVLLYVFEIKKIQDSFLTNEDYNAVTVSKNLSKLGTGASDRIYNAELISLLNRHYSAALIIKSRILTISLSFLTGMILCFMGGLFVLGKFSEGQTTISAAREKISLSLVSSSPGIIISFLGVCLIAISIFSKTSLLVEDKPIYMKESLPFINSGEINISDSLTKTSIDSLKEITNPK